MTGSHGHEHNIVLQKHFAFLPGVSKPIGADETVM